MGTGSKRDGNVRTAGAAKRRPNRSGTVFFRKDRQKWFAEVHIDGKSRSRSADTKEEAERHLQVLLRAVEEHALASTDRQTLAQYLASWLDHRRARADLRARTFYVYRSYLRHAVREIGMISLAELRPIQVQRFYDSLMAPPTSLSARAVLGIHGVLHHALDQAVDLDLLPTNPADRVKPPRPPKREARHLSFDEYEALVSVAAGTRWHALWVVMGTMGLRVGEAIVLRWSDVDWQERTLQVDETLTQDWDGNLTVGPPKTEKSDREVAMPDAVIAALQAHQRIIGREGWTWGPKDWVFPSIHGRRLDPSVVKKQLQAHAKEAGLEGVTPHVLRHTAATVHLEDATPIHVVKDILGHASIKLTVDLYGHTDQTMQREAMARLDRRLKGEA